MKKTIFVFILVLSVQMAFGSQEIKYRDYGYRPEGIGMFAGSIVMMSLSSLTQTVSSVILTLSACDVFLYASWYMANLFSIPFTLSFQTFIAGSLMLNLACKKYGSKSYNYIYDSGKLMRNSGIIIMTTSLVPAALAAAKVGYAVSWANYLGEDYQPDGVFIAECILTFLQLASGTAFLAMGLYRIHLDKMPLPEVSLVHDDKKALNEGYGVSLGMRIRI